ncbi:integrin alpha-4-like isoform X2 [Mercenaria mercenaria]|nr:integrin alpha-4-like isoform X2 [Mercenaria mercenaria]
MVGMCIKLTDQLTQISCDKEKDKHGCWPFWASVADRTANENGSSVFTYAEAGMSVAFTQDGYEIIGAPGVDDWRGAYRSPNKGWKVRLGHSSSKTTYFGYKLDAGKFKIDADILSGVPNYHITAKHGHYGRVVFHKGQSKKGNIEYGVRYDCPHEDVMKETYFEKAIHTEQHGTKFGAALETVDLTGDGYDEVLVGAPMYSDHNPDEGRVFVYTFSKTKVCGPVGVFSGGANVESLKGKTSYARFGTNIASAGDLDLDGFNDVAIGAPYEEGETGAVYIYNGCNCILRDKFSQRISGRNIDPGIRALGWSIYGNEDIDGNSFVDLAVGAYASDTVAILRTRPVVKVDTKITISPNLIPLNATLLNCSVDVKILCFHVYVHFQYETVGPRKKYVKAVSLLWAMKADTLYERREDTSRVVFKENNINKWVENITLETGKTASKAFTLIVKGNPEPKDVWTKVRIEGTMELTKSEGNVFDVLDPVISKDTTTFISKDVEFDKKCKSLDTCTSDLQVKVEMFVAGMGHNKKIDNDTEIYVGEATELMVVVEVRSLEDTSHNVVFTSNVSALMRLSTLSNYGIVDASCDSSNLANNTDISLTICKANNILFKARNVKVKSYYDISSLVLLPNNDVLRMKDNIKVEVTADQENPDVNLDNNIFERQINVKLKYRIDIEEDNTVADQINYNTDVSSRRLFSIVHRYYITNRGPSFLPLTYVNITIPVKKADTDIAMIKNISETCSLTGLPKMVLTQGSSTSLMKDVEQELRSSYFNENTYVDKRGRVKNITCLDENYVCVTIECKLTDMEQHQQEIIEFTVDVLEKELSKEKGVYEVRYGTLAIMSDPYIWYGNKTVAWNKPVFAEKWTSFILKQELLVPEVNIWIIISSSVGGLAVLFLVVFVMWKCKFFERKSHAQIQKWKGERGNVSSDRNELSADFDPSCSGLTSEN